MLREINNIKQNDNENHRFWFQSSFFDLILWCDKSENITRFELCYSLHRNEKVFIWSYKTGYDVKLVDDGEGINQCGKKMSAIYSSYNIDFDKLNILEQFIQESDLIKSHKITQVIIKIAEFKLNDNCSTIIKDI